MSITASQRFRLGVFVIIAVTVIFVLLIISIGIKFSEKTVNYYSEFSGESLSGLTKGMDVKFRGIPVGKVSAINYNPKDLSKVKVEFEVEKKFPMKEDMFVETGLSGITGLKYIEIMGGTNESAVLPPNSLIASRPSLMGTIAERAETILENIEELLKNLNTVVNRDSLADLFLTFRNMREFTDNINSVGGNLILRVDSITIALNNMSRNIDMVVSDFSENGRLPNIMANIDSTIISLRNLSQNFGLTFMQSREDLGSTLEDLRQTMENVNELSAMLLDNPSLLLYGNHQKKRKTK
ncbi:MAG: MlaD family protein [Chitinispirillales bacterium]|jgi:phospholipid/cholesterol/gamma-HCH transport system substrate-binding protein|nr:MlaD family protein [Chitinispirillales bacterium]